MIYQPCFTHLPFSPEWPFHQLFYKPSLHSSLSASILAFCFTRKLKVLLGGCSDPFHQSLFFQASVFTHSACICPPKSMILRAWPQTSSIGGSGNFVRNADSQVALQNSAFQPALGEFHCRCKFDKHCSRETHDSNQDQSLVYHIPSVLHKDIALARPPSLLYYQYPLLSTRSPHHHRNLLSIISSYQKINK